MRVGLERERFRMVKKNYKMTKNTFVVSKQKQNTGDRCIRAWTYYGDIDYWRRGERGM